MRITVEAERCQHCGRIWVPKAEGEEPPFRCPNRACRRLTWRGSKALGAGVTVAAEPVVLRETKYVALED